MLKNACIAALLLSFGLVFIACGRPASPEPPLVEPAKKETKPTAKAGWEQTWELVLAEAKKEGAVAVYALWRPETRTSVNQAFKEKYGINVEFSPFSRGAEILAKVQAEHRAGLYAADIFGAGGPTLVATMKPENVLGPLEPLLILPEVLDPKSWSAGKFPFLDRDKLAVGMIAAIQRYTVYNTDLVKKGEVTTYKDVLKPQYKGKITLNDPSVTGVGNAFLSHLALDIWNLEETKGFLRQLIKQQEVVIQRDNRLHVESVARGKYAIGLAPYEESLADFLKLGAPIEVLVVKEGTFVSPGSGALAIPTKLAHPNAARVFINWLLTREGQTVFARSYGNPSLRSDVSSEAIHPVFLPQPGEKLFLDSEEAILFRGQMLTIAKQVIEEASK